MPCLKQGGEDGLQCLATFALPLLQGLCSLLPEAQEDMLHLLFDSMIVAVGANAPATAAMEPVLTPLLVQVWAIAVCVAALQCAEPIPRPFIGIEEIGTM